MARRWRNPALVAAVLAVLPGVAGAEIVYSDSFHPGSNYVRPGVSATWSTNVTDTTPGTPARSADEFLGQFGNESVYLELAGLPEPARVTVSFDLYLLRSWDGSTAAVYEGDYRLGPDHWRLEVVGGPVLLDTTFSNHTPGNGISPDSEWQTFSGGLAVGNVPALTGAAEVHTLGYTHPTLTDVPMDSVYRLTFSFEHSGGPLQLLFTGLPNQGLEDESWGLDNVVVSVSMPEPSTLTLVGLGSAALAGCYWRRRRVG